jgi:hypothetical protein
VYRIKRSICIRIVLLDEGTIGVSSR